MAPYPADPEREQRLADGRRVLIRPIRADDQPAERQFFDHLSGETRQLRFMKYVAALNDQLLHFFTHIDYHRHMAFVCEYDGRLVGEARYLANPDGKSCEFGVVIADDWHGRGIAALLMEALIAAATARGFETMAGLVLAGNAVMLAFARDLGFEAELIAREPAMVRVVKRLRPAGSRAPSLTRIKPRRPGSGVLGAMKRKIVSRIIAAALIVGGGLLMWLSPETLGGALVMGTGVALEVLGLALERG